VRTPPPADPRPSRRQLSSALLLAGLLGGCFTSTEGEPPPTDELYFPVGLSLFGETPDGPAFLAVANSDYDLHYNSGNVFVLDAARIRALVPRPCALDEHCVEVGVCDNTPNAANQNAPSFTCISAPGVDPCADGRRRSAADRSLYPGRCEYQPIDDEMRLSVQRIGAFATDVLYRPNPDPSDANKLGRLFVPVRGDATLHWIDVRSDGTLDCGDDDGACDGYHRVGDDPDEENTRDLRLDPEPFALAASAEGPAIVVTNRTTGKASLFVNDWATRPTLKHALEGLPAYPVGIAALPTPAIVQALQALHAEPREDTALADVAARWQSINYDPGFLVSFGNVAEVDLLRYFQQDPSQNEDYLRRADRIGIHLNSAGYDSRGIAIQTRDRSTAELRCATRAGVDATCLGDAACLGGLSPEAVDSYLSCVQEAASTPLDVYVANRSPASLLVGRTRPVVNDVQSAEVPDFYAAIPLTLGPSRVITGEVLVGEANGVRSYEPRVFAICFDSRRIFVYDPVRRMVDTEITTGRGPHAVAIDPDNALLFIGHFTDSYIGVVSIDRRFPQTYGRTLATIGKPVPPRTSK
jgi:hypothetical protein